MSQSISHIFPFIVLSICMGVLFIGIVSFIYLSFTLRNALHFSMLTIAIVGFTVIALNIGLNIVNINQNAVLGRQLHRLYAVTANYYLIGIPLLIYQMLHLVPRWRSINYLLIFAGGVFAIVFSVAAFVKPHVFISVTESRNIQIGLGSDVAHGAFGFLYVIRDTALSVFMVYFIICFLFELLWHRHYKYVFYPLFGAVFAIVLTMYDFIDMYIYRNVYYYGYSYLSNIGITVFIVLSMVGVLRMFIDHTRNLDKMHKIESLGLFAGGIAHDFNNLLTIVLGNISMIKMDLSDNTTQYRERIIQAEEACVRAKGLTQQLLTFSTGGSPIRQVISVKELLTGIVHFVLSGSDISVEFDFSDELYNLLIDKEQISQVIHNILLNAMHAMPDGGTIYIKAENEWLKNTETNKEEMYVQFVIRDTGSGIPHKNLNKIFDPYFTTRTMGTGLGLTIAYSIVQKHNGKITVESKEGSGTAFKILLPAVTDDVSDIMQTDNCRDFKNERILVMDDEKLILEITSKMLTKMGFAVDIAHHGEEAVELFEKSTQDKTGYSCLIMDLTVPGKMGGKQAIQILRKKYPDIKAIVTSGYSNDPVLSNYKSYGFDAMLTKPYKFQELNRVLQSVL